MKKNIKNISSSLLFLFLIPLLSVAQTEEVPTLESVEFNVLSADKEQVFFKLNGTYIPKIFAIKGKNPRVVFDFPNTITARTLNNIITTNGHFIKQIRIGIHEGEVPKTRVVLDLIPDKETDFNQNFDQQNNVLTVTVYYADSTPATPAVKETKPTTATTKPPEKQAPPPLAADIQKTAPTLKPEPQPSSPDKPPILTPESTPLAPAPTKKPGAEVPKAENQLQAKNNGPSLLSSVKFDGSSNRGEMIKFKLKDFNPPIVFGIEEGLPRVVCDFKNTKVDESVKKTIPVGGQYVKNIRIGQHKNPNKIRVVIDLEPNNNYDLQQVFFKEDKLFVIIVNIMHNTPPITELEKPLKNDH